MTAGLVLVRSGGEADRRHPVRAEMVIGRSRGCELRLEADGVRRRHAVIEHFSSGFAIRGLSSSAVILVNDEPVLQRTLRPGDRISIGQAHFAVEESDPDPARAPPAQERTPALVPEDPVPAQVLARVRKPETPPPQFSGPPMSRVRSIATNRSATFVCLAIVLADAIALGFYIEGI